jgi:hypothetical protein
MYSYRHLRRRVDAGGDMVTHINPLQQFMPALQTAETQNETKSNGMKLGCCASQSDAGPNTVRGTDWSRSRPQTPLHVSKEAKVPPQQVLCHVLYSDEVPFGM